MIGQLPVLTPKEVIAAPERCGFRLVRISGSHHILKHPTDPRLRLSIAVHRRTFKSGTLRRIVRDAGMTLEEFLDLL